MPDLLLLRFRDLVENYSTIKEHNNLAEKYNKVIWGWWKKPLEPMADPGLQVLKRDISEGSPNIEHWVLLIDSANRTLYRARLFDVHYRQSSEDISVPQELSEYCPSYYRSKKLPAWFLIGPIEGVTETKGRGVDPDSIEAGDLSHLSRYVWSRENRTVAKQHSLTALPEREIGQSVSDSEFLDSNVSLWFITPVEEKGLPQRSRIVPPLSKSIWTARGRYAIHLSDLHFGGEHGFRNQLIKQKKKHLGKESLLEVLLEDLKASGVISSKDDQSNVATVLVTGDLTCQGDAHEFANAHDFLQKLCDELGLHPSQVVVVPGNHDIEWRDGKGEINENADYNYSQFTKNFYGAEPDASFLRIHRFLIRDRPVSIIALNSCTIESKENAGLGYVGRAQLMTALRYFNDLDDKRGQPVDELRLALVHHHLLPVNFVEDINWEQKKVSLTLDADGVLRYLLFAKVRMILHGHQHQPFTSDIRRIMHGFINPFTGTEDLLNGNIAVVGGGSIGVGRRHLNVIGRNAYNIIDLGRNDNKISVNTRLQSSVGPGFSNYYNEIAFDL